MDHEVWIELNEIKAALNGMIESLSKIPEIKQQFQDDELLPKENKKKG